MDPRIESILQHLTEDFPGLMTPEFIWVIEQSLENKAFHEQMSYLKDEILPALQEGESGILGIESSLDNNLHDESFEKDSPELMSINTVEHKVEDNEYEEYSRLKPSKHSKQNIGDELDGNGDIKEFLDDVGDGLDGNGDIKEFLDDVGDELDGNGDIKELPEKIEEQEHTYEQENKDPIEEDKQEQSLLYKEELFNYLKEKLEVISDVEELNDLIPEVKRVENEEIHQNFKALLHRKVGELYIKYSCKKEALNSFQKALEYNPKVGVKRSYNKLKKELS